MTDPIKLFAENLANFKAAQIRAQDWIEDGDNLDVYLDKSNVDIRSASFTATYNRAGRASVDLDDVELGDIDATDLSLCANDDYVVFHRDDVRTLMDSFEGMQGALAERPLSERLRDLANDVALAETARSRLEAQTYANNNRINELDALATKFRDALLALKQTADDAQTHNYGTLNPERVSAVVNEVLGYNATPEQPNT